MPEKRNGKDHTTGLSPVGSFKRLKKLPFYCGRLFSFRNHSLFYGVHKLAVFNRSNLQSHPFSI